MTPLHQRIELPLVNLILSGAALAVLAAEAPAALRAPVVLAFVLFGLGLSALQFLSFGELVADLSFVLAAGLALVTALTAAMLYLVAWSPQTALLTLALLCMALALTRLGWHLKPRWQRRGRSGQVASRLEAPPRQTLQGGTPLGGVPGAWLSRARCGTCSRGMCSPRWCASRPWRCCAGPTATRRSTSTA